MPLYYTAFSFFHGCIFGYFIVIGINSCFSLLKGKEEHKGRIDLFDKILSLSTKCNTLFSYIDKLLGT